MRVHPHLKRKEKLKKKEVQSLLEYNTNDGTDYFFAKVVRESFLRSQRLTHHHILSGQVSCVGC
jgi:hypothetical protein